VIAAVVLLGGACSLAPAAAAEAPDKEPAVKISPFGIGGDSRTTRDLTRWLPQMASAGVKVLRTCRTHWGSVEAGKGKWRWEELDRQLKYVADNGMVTGGLLIGRGRWNRKDPRGGLPLKSLPEWSEYVSQVVARAKGKVKHWEVWNEPPNFTRNAPPEDYAKVVIAAYKAAKAADPDCLVGLAAKSVDVNYLDRAIRAGAKGHFDYITLHPYEVLGYVLDTPGTEPVYMHIVATVRKMLAALDPEKANCPIWFTELGCNAGKKGADVHAQALVKAYTMGIAQGVECINWFEGIDGDSGPMGLLTRHRKPRPAYTAMTQMTGHLGPHPASLGWLLLNDRNYAFVFRGAEGAVLITWAPKGATDEIDFAREVTAVDPVTGKTAKAAKHALTNSPILVLAPPAKLVAQARANRGRPLSWGGDYSDAKSVSVTLAGKRMVEKGLHTRAGSAVAADVLAYGGSARAGTVPGGNVFMVDRGFLCYTTTPIRITAVVRRNPANKPADLKLEYESTRGYRTLPAYRIPDNRQWHTATWKIDDAQFVGKYGFNFCFNRGPYFVRSVTVTKLAK
jgi:hypothetical protein